MSSKLTLENEKNILFEKHIDKAKNGVEFFLEIYNGICLENDNIIIKGHKEVEYLPLKVSLEKIKM